MNYTEEKIIVIMKNAGWKYINGNIHNGKRFITFLNAKQEDPEAWRAEYLAKQAAGVKFECRCHGNWCKGEMKHTFEGNKEDYREVPQEVSASECQKAALEHLAKTYSADKGTAQLNPPTPHAAERALWKVQREAGTNEVWQYGNYATHSWYDVINGAEPQWVPEYQYRVKPMKLIARIVQNKVMLLHPFKIPEQDWEFFGTREEYRAECEKYGCAVVSEIKEVVEKPKTVKVYVATVHRPCATKEHFEKFLINVGFTIIGDIEEREVPAS